MSGKDYFICEAVKQRAMQSLPQEHTESCPVTTSTTEKLPDTEAPPELSEPDAQERETKSNTGAETATTEAHAAETPANMAVPPAAETEPGVRSQAESKTANVPTEPVRDTKANPGRDGQKVKKQVKTVSDSRKYVPSKKAMVDPLKMDMSKPIVMPLTCECFMLCRYQGQNDLYTGQRKTYDTFFTRNF